MADILHRIGIQAPLNDVYKALTTLDGLASWWTRETRGNSSLGGVIKFVFEEKGFFDMKVQQLVEDQRVIWEVMDGHADWIGTQLHWEMKQEGDYSIILFKHQGWKEPNEGMHHCSTKWAIFLMSLKAYLETGNGSPAPDDMKIDNWN
jgi:uncharacterized protein YndB with AHSA1/START domain